MHAAAACLCAANAAVLLLSISAFISTLSRCVLSISECRFHQQFRLLFGLGIASICLRISGWLCSKLPLPLHASTLSRCVLSISECRFLQQFRLLFGLGIASICLRISGWLCSKLPPHAACAAEFRVIVARFMTTLVCLGLAMAWLPDQP